MQYLLEGVQYGLVLAVLVGPLVVLLVQTGVEYGTRVGLAAGAGIWLSDLLFIGVCHYGLAGVEAWLAHPLFTPVVGGLGTLVLVGTGLLSLLTPPPDLDADLRMSRRRAAAQAFGRGFAYNTFNPFTVFFWVTAATTLVLARRLTDGQAGLLYAGILGTVVVTDALKVLLARRLRRRLTPARLRLVRRVAGVLLMGCGLVLAVRVVLG